MKTIKLVPLLLLMLVSSMTYAQNFELILLGGMNASQVNGDKLAGFDKVSYHAGAGIRRTLTSNTSLQFEIMYSRKGSRDVVTSYDPVQDTLFRFNYIDIPVLATFRVYQQLYVQGGIYAGVLVNASYDDGVIVSDKTNDLYRLDWGVAGGLEYRINPKWLANLRISQSVLDINKQAFTAYYNLVSSLGIRYIIQ